MYCRILKQRKIDSDNLTEILACAQGQDLPYLASLNLSLLFGYQ
jgi:hypothetical protein